MDEMLFIFQLKTITVLHTFICLLKQLGTTVVCTNFNSSKEELGYDFHRLPDFKIIGNNLTAIKITKIRKLMATSIKPLKQKRSREHHTQPEVEIRMYRCRAFLWCMHTEFERLLWPSRHCIPKSCLQNRRFKSSFPFFFF